MDTLSSDFQNLNIDTNFEFIGYNQFKPRAPQPNPVSIDNHKKTILYAMNKYLHAYQIEYVIQHKKRSTLDETSILNDFFQGDIAHKQILKDEYYYAALDFTYRKFRPPRKYRPVHILDVEHHYPHRNASNAEAPFSTEPFFLQQLNDPIYRERHNLPENPKKTFGNMKSIIFDWTRRFLHEIKDGSASFDKYLYYILLHNKTALIHYEDENKLRSISGFPRPANLAFIMFYWPYMAYAKRNISVTPLLWGYETILGGMFRLNHELQRSHLRSSIVTLDKSRFDKFYSFQIQDDIDEMFQSFIDFEHGYMPTNEYSETHIDWTKHKSDRLKRLFQWLCYTFRNTPTVIYDGSMYRRKHSGMPSGIYTTQLFDTIHFCITNATCLFQIGIDESQILLYKGEGDDILFQLSIFIPPQEHQNFLDKYQKVDDLYFGSIIRPEKCQVNNNVNGITVLGYTNQNGLPIRDSLDLIAQLYHTKQTDPTPSRTMSVAIGIAYASCGFDKQVYNICKDIYDYYASQGYQPSEETFYRTFYYDVSSSTELFDINVFPSISKIQNRLLDFDYSVPETAERFYPRSHFLDDF